MTAMPTGGPLVWPPHGFIDWHIWRRAKQFATGLVKAPPMPESFVHLDAERTDEMLAVNDQLAREFIYTPDREEHGKSDFWTRPTQVGPYLRGDCEDHALEAKARLMALGWPESCLRLCLCVLPIEEVPVGQGRAHVVLTLEIRRDGRRTYVIDCLRPHRVQIWTDYRWRLANKGHWSGPGGQWIRREKPQGFLWEAVQ